MVPHRIDEASMQEITCFDHLNEFDVESFGVVFEELEDLRSKAEC